MKNTDTIFLDCDILKKESELFLSDILEKMKSKFGDEVYRSWLQNISFHSVSKDTVNFSVPSNFIKQQVSLTYLPEILDFWKRKSENIKYAHIFVEKKDQNKFSFSEKEDKNLKESMFSNVKKDSLFETFVVGNSNKLAFSVCLDVAKNTVPEQFNNPVYIFGKPGVGKTHLIHAVYNSVKKNFLSKKIIYLTAESFMRFFIKSLKENDVMSFKKELRETDVFMVDDIQFLSGKEHTEEEFFYTFSYLIDNNKQVLLSADRPPKDLKKISERLKSRFGSGILIDVAPPDKELRVKILRKKLFGIVREDILDEVVEYLSNQITTSVREIEGAVNKIFASKMVFGANAINIQQIKELVEPLVCKQKEISIDLIISCVCNYFDLTKKEVTSKSRESKFVTSRQLVMYFAKIFTKMSNSDIGSELGGRDHATVSYAVKKISSSIKSNKDLSRDVCFIEEQIRQD